MHFYFEIYTANETQTVRCVLVMQQTCNATTVRYVARLWNARRKQCPLGSRLLVVFIRERLVQWDAVAHQITTCVQSIWNTWKLSGSALPQITSETLVNAAESGHLYQEAKSGIPHKPGQTQIQSFIYEDRATNTPVCPLTLLTYSDSKVGRLSPCRIKKDLTIRWGD